MPIERRDPTSQIRSVLIAVVSLVFIVTLGYAVFRAATGQQSSVATGANDGTWTYGSAEDAADSVAEDGPILFSDVSGKGQRRPIAISHDGRNARTGWHAFVARPPTAPEDCFLRWNARRELFTTTCDDRTFPADGEGLTQLPVRITKTKSLIIDVRPEAK